MDTGIKKCMRGNIRGIILNATAASENVPTIERQIRVIKEKACPIRSTLPFKKIPNRMIVELINFVFLCGNSLSPSSGISDTFSPQTTMTGTDLDYRNHS
jgi:hypothetical protein